MKARVLIFGKFDIIHPGHIKIIKKAKQLGQVTAVLESDQAIKSLRNYSPYYKQSVRKKKLESFGVKVFTRTRENAEEILKKLQPDILFFGEDQIILQQMFANFENKKISPLFKKDIFNSSKIRSVLEDESAGIYLVDKPKAVNSFKAVTVFRKVLDIKKVGFSGTLDPLASGLLILSTGRATKILDWFHILRKTYIADICFGKTSDTYDLEGKIKQNKKANSFSKNDLEKKLKIFLGVQNQLAPVYSAKKLAGQKLHKLARQGKKVERPVKEIEIYSLDIKYYEYPNLKLEVCCSAGTYIRSLADDLGQTMGTGAILSDLKRIKIGDFLVENSLKLKDINKLKLAKNKIKPEEAINQINTYFMGLTN